jgi:hypothetical protein
MALARTLPGPIPKRVRQTVVRPAETGQVVNAQVPRPEVSAATPLEAYQLPAAKVHARGPAGPAEIICQASWVQKPGAPAEAPAGEVQPPTAQITAAAHVAQAARARAQVAKARIAAVGVIGGRVGGRGGVAAGCLAPLPPAGADRSISSRTMGGRVNSISVDVDHQKYFGSRSLTPAVRKRDSGKGTMGVGLTIESHDR